MAEAGSPLALPWREALDTALVHTSACPVRITGSRAYIGTSTGSHMTIDGHEVALKIDGRMMNLRTAELLGAKVCRHMPQPHLHRSVLIAVVPFEFSLLLCLSTDCSPYSDEHLRRCLEVGQQWGWHVPFTT